MGGHHHHRLIGVVTNNFVKHFFAGHFGQHKVQQYDFVTTFQPSFQSGFSIAGVSDFKALAQYPLNQLGGIFVIFYNQNT